ncbi:MAG TPA: nucleotidyltransferase family protein [Dehalococcoidia bacterium]
MIAAILLAAGESRRMGSPKPLLDWAGETLIEYQVHQLCDAGVDTVIAVLGHSADQVRPLAERAGAAAVLNDHYAEGRASSLRAGAAAVPPSTAEIAVLNVDQPRPALVTARLLAEHLASGALITLPTYEGRRGHPAFLCGSLLPELLAATDADEGLRAVIHRHNTDVREISFDTPIVLLDINTREDYERARTEFQKVVR